MGAADVASRDILCRLRSEGSAEVGRLPVLRFFGRDSGCNSLPRPRSSGSGILSAPGRVAEVSAGGSGHDGEDGKDETREIEGQGWPTIFVLMSTMRLGHSWRRRRRRRLRLGRTWRVTVGW